VSDNGRYELLAGGKLFSHDGRILWGHDRQHELMRTYGAGHYDSVALGNYAGESELDPVAFLIAGSVGVYGVEGYTRGNHMIHRAGYAQHHYLGRFRDDLHDTQVVAVCRWGNMGIQTLFSGSGDRLRSIHPNYFSFGSVAALWENDVRQLIWVKTSDFSQGLYDGSGRKEKPLPALRDLCRWRHLPAIQVFCRAPVQQTTQESLPRC